MPNYRRAKITGATWFFTVNLLERHNNNLLIKEIALLKASIKKVYRAHPFEIVAWVVYRITCIASGNCPKAILITLLVGA